MKRLTTFMMLQTNLNNTSKDLLYLNGVEIRKSERYIKKNEKHINTMPINIGDIDPEPYDLKNSEFYDLEKNNNNMENLIKDLTTILPEKQIETFLTNILENTELFYKYNDMISYKYDSPLVREEISNAEKKIDQYEIIFQSIINSIQEMNKSSLIYFKGINGFLIEVDKLNKLLNKNHELLILVSIIVEIVQGFKVQLEKIINTINDGISEPLLKFVNSEFNKKKHLKKIYDESLNDYEKKQLKIMEFKKKKV